MSVAHEGPLGLSLVPSLCKQLLGQDPSFDDLRFAPGLSDGEVGWYHSLRAMFAQDTEMTASTSFSMDDEEVEAALFGLKANMPSKAQQTFESLAMFIGSASHLHEQWEVSVRMATRLLRASGTDLQRGIALRAARELFQGIAEACGTVFSQGLCQDASICHSCWDGSSKRLN